MGVGKSKAKVYIEKETGVTFKDVAGEEEAKESLVEVVDFLHNPAKVHGDWCETAEGSTACRTSGNRQDTACKSRGRRGPCAVLLSGRF